MINSRLYDRIVVKGPKQQQDLPGTKTYKGFSTISADSETYALYDLQLIKQDIINHFHIRQGERLENPTFGTIIWDMLFEPFTQEVQDLIAKDVETIINYDPRVAADNLIVTQYESGIQIEVTLVYLPYNIQETMQFRFDQDNKITS